MSQEKLARELGVSKNTVARWEAGSGIEADNLDALAGALQVSADWILRGDERPAPTERVPKHWQDFLNNYVDIDELTEDDLGDLRRALMRGGDSQRSWQDYVPLANALRDINRNARRAKVG